MEACLTVPVCIVCKRLLPAGPWVGCPVLCLHCWERERGPAVGNCTACGRTTYLLDVRLSDLPGHCAECSAAR